LAAVAAAARARLEQERARGLRLAAMRRLAIAMGRRDADFDAVQGDLYALPEISGFETLAALLERSPELGRFADERRLREARLQLVQASARADWEWQLGVRRLEESDDWAAVAGLAVPLGTRSRTAPAVRAAQAELAELELARDTEQLALHATLVEAYLRLRAAAAEAAFATTELLPALEQAATAMERAYRVGAANYLDWALVQAEHADARRERLSAALEARKALIEIQRLTGEPFVTTPVAAIGEGIDP
jgi:cobalt-zinc-cadmium efflux system outer membrane protein